MSKSAIDPNWVDPDDVPELTDEWFKKAELRLGDHVIRKGGRPAQDKVPVSIRLSRSVVEHFKADGPGWQTRIDEALKRAIA